MNSLSGSWVLILRTDHKPVWQYALWNCCFYHTKIHVLSFNVTTQMSNCITQNITCYGMRMADIITGVHYNRVNSSSFTLHCTLIFGRTKWVTEVTFFENEMLVCIPRSKLQLLRCFLFFNMHRCFISGFLFAGSEWIKLEFQILQLSPSFYTADKLVTLNGSEVFE